MSIKNSDVRVRLAPSPTGKLHIGTARTALFNYLFAKHNGGKFLVRIEDTDKARSTKEFETNIIDSLKWLGLNWDEELVYQSNNIERHVAVAKELLARGLAYLCYEEGGKSDDGFRLRSEWRDRIAENPATKPVIRMKVPLGRRIVIEDVIQGRVEVGTDEIEDFVLLRSDETPTFLLSCAVDDHDMRISHVIRGNDHLTNGFKQFLIYEAMDWDVPVMGHIPLIHGTDGGKLSKRHGATSVTEYKEQGYLPIAIRNYLLRLGFSHGNDEIITDEDAIKWFEIERVNRSPSAFDVDKLNYLNKYYLNHISNDELAELITARLDCSDEEKRRILLSMDMRDKKATTLNEMADSCRFYLNGGSGGDVKIDANIVGILSLIDIWNEAAIKEKLMAYAKEVGIGMKEIGIPLRIVLTFTSESSGGIFKIMEILGKREVLRRINNN